MIQDLSADLFARHPSMEALARDLLDQMRLASPAAADPAREDLRQILAFAIDASQQLAAAQVRVSALEHNNPLDPVTGLLSETGLRAAFARCSAAAARYGEPGVLLVIEVDALDAIGDIVHRTSALDAYNRALANALIRQVRSCDSVARLGDGVFAAVLERCPPGVAVRKGNAIAKALSQVSLLYADRRIENPARVGWTSFGAGSTLVGAISAARHCLSVQDRAFSGLH